MNTKQIKYIELYNFMKTEKFSRKEMADLLGVGYSTFGNILNCHIPVRDEVIQRFCTLSGKTEDEVVAKPGDYLYQEPKRYKSELAKYKKKEAKELVVEGVEEVEEVAEEKTTVTFTEDEARTFARKKKMFGESKMTKEAEAQYPEIFKEICGDGEKSEDSVFMVTEQDKKIIQNDLLAEKYEGLKKWVCELIMDGRKTVELSEIISKVI